jgi:hypothetical protein
MARGRKKLSLTREELQSVVNELEEKQTFASLAMLWKAVGDTEWAKTLEPRALTPQVAMLRAKELGVTTKTQAGRIGAGRVAPASGERRKVSLPVLVEQVATRETPEKYHDLLRRAQAGSRKAALKLKCLECSNWQRSEIAFCPILGCALWQFRPYQRANHPAYTSATQEQCQQKLTELT